MKYKKYIVMAIIFLLPIILSYFSAFAGGIEWGTEKMGMLIALGCFSGFFMLCIGAMWMNIFEID